jgi:hypothetical protein
VIDVAEVIVKLLALDVPNITAVAPLRFVPAIVTLPAPSAAPVGGVTFVTVGGGT